MNDGTGRFVSDSMASGSPGYRFGVERFRHLYYEYKKPKNTGIYKRIFSPLPKRVMTRQPGKDAHMNDPSIKLYSLSTCSHCKSTKKLLADCTVQYEFVDVDLLEGDERKAILEDVRNLLFWI